MSHTVSGPVLFARYAYPPNALGYCGPADSRALLEYTAAGVGDRGLDALVRGFEGAWPYLSLIAAANGRRDPLDAEVVGAYWIGNHLLERVPPALLADHVDQRFARRAIRSGADLGLVAASGGRAHHNFHVFAVYPWVGLLRAGHREEPLRVLDSCRIRWGRVESVEGAAATVRCRPLVWDGFTLSLGEAVEQAAALAADGYRLAPRVRVGDRVALHWNWVCDVLDDRHLVALRRYTASQLALTNHALRRPVPAAVLDA